MSDTPIQKTFDEEYITTSEIQKRVNVTRSTILQARRRGLLPNPIIVPGNGAFIWKRADVEPYLQAWEVSLACRRGEVPVPPSVSVTRSGLVKDTEGELNK